MNYTALNMTEKQLEISQFINSTLVWGLRPYFQRETAELIIFLSNGVSLCAVNIFGVFGNTMSAYVLSRKQMKSPLNALLLKLAFCDFIIGILHFLCNAIPHLLWRYKIGEWYIKLVCFLYRYGILVWQIGLAGSTYFTVAVSVERYIAVCWPLKAKSLLTSGMSRKMSWGVAVISILIQIPTFREIILQGKTGRYYDFQCSFGIANPRNKTVIRISRVVNEALFLLFVPTISVFVLNVLISREIRQQRRTRREMTGTEAKNINSAKMVVTVVAFFVLCNSLKIFVMLLNLSNVVTFYVELTALFVLAVDMNSAVNYIIYCFFGKKFRDAFTGLFTACTPRRTSNPA